MALLKQEIRHLYRRRARNYDISANLYYLLGIREFAYRRKAVRALCLKRGDTVMEIGCGTGLNFKFLEDAVGPEGRVVGVDLTPEMLDGARRRIARNGWWNIELVQSDAAAYAFPDRTDEVISTFAMTLIPEYERVIRNGSAVLSPGKRFVVLDFKQPEHWPMWLIKFFVLLTRPFGVSLDLAERHPWESIARHLHMVRFEEFYFGGLYICTGEKSSTGK